MVGITRENVGVYVAGKTEIVSAPQSYTILRLAGRPKSCRSSFMDLFSGSRVGGLAVLAAGV